MVLPVLRYEAEKSGRMIPLSIRVLFFVAVATFLLSPFVFDYAVRQILPLAEIELPNVIKLDGYRGKVSDFEYNKYNSILFTSILYPYVILASFLLIFLIFAYSNMKIDVRFRYNKKNMGVFVIFLFISIVSYIGSLGSPRSGTGIEYHDYMTIHDYVEWQVDAYLILIGMWVAFAYIAVTSMFKFTKRGQALPAGSRRFG